MGPSRRAAQVRHGLVSPAVSDSVQAFLAANQTFGAGAAPAPAAPAAGAPAARGRAARRARSGQAGSGESAHTY